jgi:TRAP-type C4-dicarboxylate transport system permease small subunit
MTTAERISLACNRYTERSLLVLGLTMSVIVIAQVFCRYVLNHSLFWSEELARYILVWLTFLGSSVAYFRGMHPGINIIYRRLPAQMRRLVKILVLLLSLVFFMIMIWYGAQFSFFVRAQTTAALTLPKWIIFSIIPVSGAILSLHTVAMLTGEISRRSKVP